MILPRQAQIWLPDYCRGRLSRIVAPQPVRRVWLTITDHFEPFWNRVDEPTARHRVDLWVERWSEIACRCARDSRDRSPVYTFFYPEEEYRSDILEHLAELTRRGIADVEVHIHHDREGRQNFIERMSAFIQRLHDCHGLLRRENGKLRFGFIHGNWALDNSNPGGLWCGLNDEITILRDLGCYADFTMPAGAHPAQAAMVNQVYWCIDDPDRPKSHDRGIPLKSGGQLSGDLLMIPGPLGLRWRERLLPRLETGELSHNNRPNRYRVRRWFDLAPQIGGDLFIKLYTHGTQERNSSVLLHGALEELYGLIAEEAERRNCEHYWVSAWQMYRAIDALRLRQDPTQAVVDTCSHHEPRRSSVR